MTRTQREHSETPSRQAEQARLVQDGRKLAGVAEAIDVYERLHGRVASVGATQPAPRYATGGNGTD